MNVTRLLPYVWGDSPDWQIANPDGSPGQLGGAYFAGIHDALSPEPIATSPLVSAQPPTVTKTCARKRRRPRKKRKSSAKRCSSSVRPRAAKSAAARAN
jgi:hypothetical protein